MPQNSSTLNTANFPHVEFGQVYQPGFLEMLPAQVLLIFNTLFIVLIVVLIIKFAIRAFKKPK